MGSTPIVVEETYSAPPERVWQAIVDDQQMPQWFFEPITDFKPELGYETRFTVEPQGKAYVHLWEVTEVIPRKRLVYRWRYEAIPGDSTVTWEIDETRMAQGSP